MKVLILQDRLRSGGTERQSILLARGLRGAGVDSRLVTFRPGGALWSAAADVAPRALQRRDLGWDWYAPGLGRAVRDYAPDILFAMGRMANCQLARAAAALPAGAKTVGSFRTGKTLPWLFRRSLRRADAVVANSGAAAATLQNEYGLPGAKVHVIYNALVFPAAEPAGARPPHPPTRFLSVAMFRPEKGQRRLIDIFAGLPADTEWELLLAGDGPARRECESRVRILGLTHRIHFLGHQADPSALYRTADAAVHASRSEALSNFLIEAQAHGLPCVAADAQGIAECFQPGSTGWVVAPDDEGAFRAAVAGLIRMPPAERIELGRRARAFAAARFDPTRQLDAYRQLFRTLLSRPA